jgi:DNA helicase II / ATP-dependent DNA helicase PcrA
VDEVRARVRDGRKLSDIAVLYRSNAQSRIIEHALFGAGIAYRVYGGLRFFERAEIKHALAYLRLAANPDDDISFMRVVNFPPRGIGARSVDQIQTIARLQGSSLFAAVHALEGRAAGALAQFGQIIQRLKQASVSLTLPELVQDLLERSGLNAHYRSDKDGADRLENLAELVNAAAGFVEEHDGSPYEEDIRLAPSPSTPAPDPVLATGDLASAGDVSVPAMLQAFLAHAALESGDNQAQAGQDAMQMMTVHASKGLEFDTVFVTGLEEGLFPHENSLNEADGLEEERRLAYVAITRAERRLYLSFTQSRMLHGQVRYGMRSRFIDELPAAAIEVLTPRMRPSFTSPAQPAWSSGSHMRSGSGGQTGHTRSGSRSAEPVRTWTPSSGTSSITHTPTTSSVMGATKASAHGLRVGQSVRHVKFGDGVVVRLQGNGTDERAQINFGAFGMKELLLSVAKLEAR